jgi:PleD family two-component response regulator
MIHHPCKRRSMTAEGHLNQVNPQVLLASQEELFTRSLESVLTQSGYRVLVAGDAQRTLAQARAARPDAILLDLGLGQPPGFEVCRALRAEPAVSMATPIVMTTAGPAPRALQLEALRAGAWELRGDPVDTEELVLRLSVYVQGKLEADRAGAAGMVDPASGLYNAAGVSRRSEELASLTARQGLSLACVVFRSTNGGADDVARAFKTYGRVSDAIGRMGDNEFAVFAPATDEPAARRLIKRLSATVSATLRAGYSAAPAIPPLAPGELLARARTALDSPSSTTTS